MKKTWKRICGTMLFVMASMACAGCEEKGGAGRQHQEVSSRGEEVGADAASPTSIPIQDQLDLIVSCREKWLYQYELLGKDFSYPEAFAFDIVDYTVTDLDQNGRLEIIRSITSGNGSDYYNDYYEVNETGDDLEQIISKPEEGPGMGNGEPDWGAWLQDAEEYPLEVYYEEETGRYHYCIDDYTHGSGVDTDNASLDLVLENGKIDIAVYAYEHYKNGKMKSYSGRKEERVSQEELRKYAEEYFGEMVKGELVCGGFDQDTIIEKVGEGKKYRLSKEGSLEKWLEDLSQERLYDEVKSSWEKFQIKWEE